MDIFIRNIIYQQLMKRVLNQPYAVLNFRIYKYVFQIR
jgi:hypothetical protein